MSIKSRFAIVLALLLLGFAATVAFVRTLEWRAERERVAAQRKTQAQLAEHWLDAASKALPLFAEDAASAAPIISAVEHEDWNHVRALLQPALGRAGVTAAWVYGSGGAVELNVGPLTPPSLAPADFAMLVAETPRPRFFVAEHGALAEVAARRIRAGAAPAVADHWLVAARVWDAPYLQHLGALLDSTVALEGPEAVNRAPGERDDVLLVRPLLDWAGRPIASLRIDHALPPSEKPVALQTWTMLGFGLLLLIATVVALQQWVVRPLRQISDSLAREDARVVASLESDTSEFGEVARLVRSSFAQRDALAGEITERKRTQESLEKTELDLRRSMEERVRLGRDLHDGIIQSLYAAGMGLAGIRPLLQPEQTEAAARLEQTRAALNETIHDVRNFIVGLEPEALKLQSFTHAVHRLLEIMQAIRPIAADVTIDETLAERLTLSQRVHALQIAREAVSNALRHGNATEIGIALRRAGLFAEFEIRDNGHGFDVHAAGPGRGLANFAQRARELGGELGVESEPGRGTTVRLTFSFHS